MAIPRHTRYASFATQQIAAWLKQSGRKLWWLAEQVGVTAAHLSCVMTGSRRPSRGLVINLCNQVPGLSAEHFDMPAVPAAASTDTEVAR